MPTRLNGMRRLSRRRGLARLFVAALVLTAGGCRTSHPGVAVEHRPGDGPNTCPVPYAATYVLWAVGEPGCAVALLERAEVQNKYQVGFIREPDGGLVAYASGRKFPLPEGHYVWQISPETQKTRGELVAADVGKLLAKALTAAGWVAVGAACIGVVFVGAFFATGGHN